MTHKRRKSGEHHPRGVFVGKTRGKQDRSGAFGGVEDQREDSRERACDAGDVGCADVAAPGLAHVGTAE